MNLSAIGVAPLAVRLSPSALSSVPGRPARYSHLRQGRGRWRCAGRDESLEPARGHPRIRHIGPLSLRSSPSGVFPVPVLPPTPSSAAMTGIVEIRVGTNSVPHREMPDPRATRLPCAGALAGCLAAGGRAAEYNRFCSCRAHSSAVDALHLFGAGSYNQILMRPCSSCAHVDREQIDAELLHGISLRTVASRHGMSASALHRHRTAHVDGPTVADLLEPADNLDSWRRFDGNEWQRCPAPKAEDLTELRCRPESYRTNYSMELHGYFVRRTYRLRRSKSRSSR